MILRNPEVKKDISMPPQTQSSSSTPKVAAAASHVNVSPLDAYNIQVNGVVYSAAELAKDHPGGEMFVHAFAGRDASEAFLSYHRKAFPHDKMTFAAVGTAKPNKPADRDEEYLELCRIVEKVLPRNASFATTGYFIKIFAILALTFSLEGYIHYTHSYFWYFSAIMGFLYALIGLNIQHDANHGSLSRNPFVNRIFGYTQNYIGGSAIDWIHQHVVQHHVETNDVHHDPDIAGGTVLRINPLKKVLTHYRLQHIYVFIVIGMFGFSTVVTSCRALINGIRFTPFSKMVTNYRYAELSSYLFFAFRWVYLPLFRGVEEGGVLSWSSLVSTAPLYMVAGYYLAFFFIISHNFRGVSFFDSSSKNALGERGSFLRNQVMSSSNVAGAFLGFCNGGLNYQIEHHLFPRICNTHYPTIAPLVRSYCLSKGITYKHFPTVLENFISCSNHLFDMSTAGMEVIRL